ncbi:RES family NAD+ phosphorylase [Shewanella sp.]|uniref:RES family NAD+ phosphorylase n=1 Tax=Shewanella sp. TaxID=50422 RepID=UPI001A3B3058|nr:RES family NAD+ phosphorylase [Shewanella sp.]MBL4817584.1 RES family NAD+ phosphorylase [Shewanella sp.]MCJ8302983.1 RES family NAD+ phosphorylase [Shewanella sp.]
MITAYRIVKKKWAGNAFDGEGARLYGGRWNSRGQSCVYLAGSESLAILEILVHLDNARQITHYALFSVELDEKDIMLLDHDSLPHNWQEDPAPADTADLGDEWLSSQSSLALCVPSSIVTRERNFLLNVDHPAFDNMMDTKVELEFSMDTRLF